MCARWNVIKTSRLKGEFRSCKSDVHKRRRQEGCGRSAFWIIKPSAQSTRGHTLAKYTHILALTSSSVFCCGAVGEAIQFQNGLVPPPLPNQNNPLCLAISIIYIYIYLFRLISPSLFTYTCLIFPTSLGMCVCVCTPFTLQECAVTEEIPISTG